MKEWSVLILLLILNSLAISLAIIIYKNTGYNHFGENGFITILSAVQLLVVSMLPYKIYQARGMMGRSSFWRDPSVVWAIIASGFLFLAADEVLRIHENLDQLIHYVFGLKETNLTDRIDDLIVGMYGLVGIGVLIAYRDELKKYMRNPLFLVLGFVLMFTMVVLDTLSHKNDILAEILGGEMAASLYGWLSFAEDSSKILAEAFFITAFYGFYRRIN